MFEHLEVQLKRTKGYRMPPGCVKVARPTMWGNPFPTAREYRLWLTTDWEPEDLRGSLFVGWGKFGMYHATGDGGIAWDYAKLRTQKQIILSHVPSLRNRPIACFCPLGDDCHRAVLIELANR